MIFSTVLGAEYLSYVKSIETHARAFFKVIIFSIGTVLGLLEIQWFETKNYEISLSATHRCRRGLWWQQQLAPREGNEDAFRRSTFEVAKQ